jgi:hypothetical protein
MLIIALVMAVIGLAALVTAIVTNNEIIAWACIGASVIGVVLLIIDALRERQQRDAEQQAESEVAATDAQEDEAFDAEYPDDADAPADVDSAPDEAPADVTKGDSTDK